MSRKKDLQDRAIVTAITGDEKDPGMQIEDDYLVRERKENDLEQGIGERELSAMGGGDALDNNCKMLYKNDKDMERLEHERCPRYTDDYPGREEEVVEREPMKLVDYTKSRDVIIEVPEGVKVEMIRSNKSGEVFCKVTAVKSGKTIAFAGAKKEGKGVWALTAIEEIQLQDKEERATTKVKA